MSTQQVNEEILAFLAGTEPEVFCIRGKWGVGKTHAWKNCMKEAKEVHRIGFSRYAYVSLFGISSLDDLKYAIFENVVLPQEGTLKADLATLDAFINPNVGSWRKLATYARSSSQELCVGKEWIITY